MLMSNFSIINSRPIYISALNIGNSYSKNFKNFSINYLNILYKLNSFHWIDHMSVHVI